MDNENKQEQNLGLSDSDIKLIEQKVQKMEEMQKQIDRKTKDAKAYRENNERLEKIIKYGIICIVIFFSVVAIAIGITATVISQQYFDYERGIEREITREVNSIESGDNGVIINKSSNNSLHVSK
jgi:hypothetical protein|nr:MAG TPA: vesicle-associated membrane protein 2 [Caudoviricetes sp.]